jgi:hypothetical protein
MAGSIADSHDKRVIPRPFDWMIRLRRQGLRVRVMRRSSPRVAPFVGAAIAYLEKQGSERVVIVPRSLGATSLIGMILG